MFPWLWVWAPDLNFPWSGSVAQRIEPNTNWFFDGIPDEAGDRRIEKKAFDVASYGRQLGLLTEVVIELADKQASLSPEATTSLRRLGQIRERIEKIKQDEASSLAEELEQRIEWLRKHHPTEFDRLRARLGPVLLEERA